MRKNKTLYLCPDFLNTTDTDVLEEILRAAVEYGLTVVMNSSEINVQKLYLILAYVDLIFLTLEKAEELTDYLSTEKIEENGEKSKLADCCMKIALFPKINTARMRKVIIMHGKHVCTYAQGYSKIMNFTPSTKNNLSSKIINDFISGALADMVSYLKITSAIDLGFETVERLKNTDIQSCVESNKIPPGPYFDQSYAQAAKKNKKKDKTSPGDWEYKYNTKVCQLNNLIKLFEEKSRGILELETEKANLRSEIQEKEKTNLKLEGVINDLKARILAMVPETDRDELKSELNELYPDKKDYVDEILRENLDKTHGIETI